MLMATICISCSDDDPSAPSAIQNDLVFTRADQSAIVFSSASLLFVWCGPWEEGAIPTPALHIIFGSSGPDDPFWMLRVVVTDVIVGVPMLFPNDFVFNNPRNADFFVADQADNPKNECSSQDSRSSGSITFQQFECIIGGTVQFSMDAVIGSEFGTGPSVSVAGSFKATVSSPTP
jgi:hypothetical protein